MSDENKPEPIGEAELQQMWDDAPHFVKVLAYMGSTAVLLIIVLLIVKGLAETIQWVVFG